jgi:alkanesulfonate monooxygenase
LLLNIVTGGNPEEQRRFGDHLDHDQRYERTAEFLQVLRGAWSGTPFDFDGRHYQVAGATVAAPPSPTPPVFFGGSSDAGTRVAAALADVWLMWGEPKEAAASELARVRRQAEEAGRADDLRFGIRLHVISRDRSEDAWAVTDRLLEAMPPEVVSKAQRQLTASESVGQQRMAALHGGQRSDLLVGPNLWAGFGLVRGGAGTALVGSHEEVAERIAEYHELGFDHFILSGQPHLEEAYWFGEGVLPILRRSGLVADGRVAGRPSVRADRVPATAAS